MASPSLYHKVAEERNALAKRVERLEEDASHAKHQEREACARVLETKAAELLAVGDAPMIRDTMARIFNELADEIRNRKALEDA